MGNIPQEEEASDFNNFLPAVVSEESKENYRHHCRSSSFAEAVR